VGDRLPPAVDQVGLDLTPERDDETLRAARPPPPNARPAAT
jgi:hypothetical protein